MNNKKCAQHARNRSLQFCLFEFAGKLSRNMSRFNRLFVLVFYVQPCGILPVRRCFLRKT